MSDLWALWGTAVIAFTLGHLMGWLSRAKYQHEKDNPDCERCK